MERHEGTSRAPRRWPVTVACLVVVVVAVLDLVGWYVEVRWMTHPVGGGVSMKPNTALALLLLAFGLISVERRPRAAAWLVSASGLLAGVFLVETLLGVRFGVDDRWPGLSFAGASGRPSPFTCLAIVLVVLSVHALLRGRHVACQALVLPALAIAYLGVLGYLLGEPNLYRVAAYSTMSFPTAVSLCLLSLSVLALDAPAWLTSQVENRGNAGRLFRRLLPFLVVGPLLIGWARLLGQDAGWYDATFGEAISSLVLTATGLFLLVHTGGQLLRSDADRDRAHGELVALNAELEDRVAERTAALAEAQALFSAAFASSPVGAALATVDGVVRDVNRVLRQLTRRTADELLGRRLADVFADDLQAEDDELRGRLLIGQLPSYELERRLQVDHETVVVQVVVALVRDSHGLHGLLYQLQDVTARKEAEVQAEHLALHDSLTDLPNRVLLRDRLDQALTLAERTGRAVGVLFVDLDDFKPVNDRYGHAAGDEVLREVAQRLRRAVRSTDTAGRIGGDEFVVVCPDVPGQEALALVAEAIASSVTRPISLGDVEVRVGASIGSALSRGHEDPDRLITRSDEAMYRVKQAARAG